MPRKTSALLAGRARASSRPWRPALHSVPRSPELTVARNQRRAVAASYAIRSNAPSPSESRKVQTLLRTSKRNRSPGSASEDPSALVRWCTIDPGTYSPTRPRRIREVYSKSSCHRK